MTYRECVADFFKEQSFFSKCVCGLFFPYTLFLVWIVWDTDGRYWELTNQ